MTCRWAGTMAWPGPHTWSPSALIPKEAGSKVRIPRPLLAASRQGPGQVGVPSWKLRFPTQRPVQVRAAPRSVPSPIPARTPALPEVPWISHLRSISLEIPASACRVSAGLLIDARPQLPRVGVWGAAFPGLLETLEVGVRDGIRRPGQGWPRRIQGSGLILR